MKSRFAILLPTLFVSISAAILVYFAWRTAVEHIRLGEQTIVDSTLLLAREKVDSLERLIIEADNEVIRRAKLDSKEALREWRKVAHDVTPSIRAVILIDKGRVWRSEIRGSKKDRRSFLKRFEQHVLRELVADQSTTLQHFQKKIDDESYLFSYQTIERDGKQLTIVAHHDTGFILREYLPTLFAATPANDHYNVVDEEGRTIFGPSLSSAGDFVVGYRFPTTLYAWRLQFAPPKAAELDATKKTRRLAEVGVIMVALFIMIAGVAFLLSSAAKERRLNELKSEFVATVSHELKTPLAAIRMFSELLISGKARTEEKRLEYATIIGRESERLSGLIDNVLDFAALERGQARYELTLGNINDVAQKAVETFINRHESSPHISLKTLPNDATIAFDQQAIPLAILNLLDNAAKYAPDSDIAVSLEHRRDFVQVSVRDFGPGIPNGKEKEIFRRFARAQGAGISGSGIGLSLVKHIAEAHGGRAWAENESEGGARISFSLRASFR